MPTAAVHGVALHYQRRGSGPRLVYCNGSGATLRSVRPMLNVMAANFDLLAFDYRGMGASAPVSTPYTMADVAADVAGLLDAVGWQSAAVAGLSFGGMVAQEFAVTFPDRVERLALLATSPGGAFPSFPLEELADLPAGERARRSLQLSDRRWTPEWLAVHPDQAALVAALAPPDSAETPEQACGRRLQLGARAGHDVLDRLHRVHCPTFVGSGRYDGIAPVTNGQAISDRIPGAALRIYDGGHLFLMQDPAAWPQLIGFLAADSR